MTEKLSIIYTLFPSHTNLLTIRDFHISYGSSAYGSALSVTSHDGAFQKYLTKTYEITIINTFVNSESKPYRK